MRAALPGKRRLFEREQNVRDVNSHDGELCSGMSADHGTSTKHGLETIHNGQHGND